MSNTIRPVSEYEDLAEHFENFHFLLMEFEYSEYSAQQGFDMLEDMREIAKVIDSHSNQALVEALKHSFEINKELPLIKVYIGLRNELIHELYKDICTDNCEDDNELIPVLTSACNKYGVGHPGDIWSYPVHT